MTDSKSRDRAVRKRAGEGSSLMSGEREPLPKSFVCNKKLIPDSIVGYLLNEKPVHFLCLGGNLVVNCAGLGGVSVDDPLRIENSGRA
jgi:hypothetical protein